MISEAEVRFYAEQADLIATTGDEWVMLRSLYAYVARLWLNSAFNAR